MQGRSRPETPTTTGGEEQTLKATDNPAPAPTPTQTGSRSRGRKVRFLRTQQRVQPTHDPDLISPSHRHAGRRYSQVRHHKVTE
jgi:hypothetical protein